MRRVAGRDLGERRTLCHICAECELSLPIGGGQCLGCGSRERLAFDSIGERDRWFTLKLLARQGAISRLERQVRFALKVGVTTIGHYVADFSYLDENRRHVVEDFKAGAVTDLAAWKLRHFAAQYGYPVRITGQD